jgi:hypothetical protein
MAVKGEQIKIKWCDDFLSSSQQFDYLPELFQSQEDER